MPIRTDGRKTMHPSAKLNKITSNSKTSNRITNSNSKISNLMAQKLFDGLMTTFCERKGLNIDGADIDGATAKMRT